MPAIEEISVEFGQHAGQREIKNQVVRALWSWIMLHRDEGVIEIQILFWKKKLRWKDLEPVIERLLGPNPFSLRHVAPSV